MSVKDDPAAERLFWQWWNHEREEGDGPYAAFRAGLATPAPEYPDALVEHIRGLVDLIKQVAPEYAESTVVANAEAELPAEVDADEELASRIAMENAPDTFPTDTCGLAGWVLRGVKAGRELQGRGG